jgi:hypothetical protein
MVNRRADFAPVESSSRKGFVLGAAVLIDATNVRILVPSAMKLLGDKNWYVPRWLPDLRIEGGHRPRPQPVVISPAQGTAADYARRCRKHEALPQKSAS